MPWTEIPPNVTAGGGGGGGGGLTDGDKGDVTVSGGGTTISIDPGAVQPNDIVIAGSSFRANASPTAGPAQDLSSTQAKALLNIFTSDVFMLDSILTGKASALHSHVVATPSSDGFMAALDKQTVDDLPAALANKSNTGHVHPDASTVFSGFMSAADKLALNDVPNQLASKSDSNHGHANATVTTSGFMSAADKNLLGSLGSGSGLTHPQVMSRLFGVA